MEVKCMCILIFVLTDQSAVRAAKTEKKTFLLIEHATVVYYNPSHFKTISMFTKRYSRYDPVYYFNVYCQIAQPIGNNALFSFYFFNEVLPHVYKRTFVEISRKGCDFVLKEPIFGAALKRAFQAVLPEGQILCPISVGKYNLQNMTLNAAALPDFPYQKGRLYLNITLVQNSELLLSSYADFEKKQLELKTTRNK